MSLPLGTSWEIWLGIAVLVVTITGIIWKTAQWKGRLDEWKGSTDTTLGSLQADIKALLIDVGVIKTTLEKDATRNGMIKHQSPLVPSEKALKILEKIMLTSEIDKNYFNIISKVNDKSKLNLYKNIKPEDKFAEITPTVIHELIKIGKIDNKKIDTAMNELGKTYGTNVASYYGILLLITSYILEKRRKTGCVEDVSKIYTQINAIYCKDMTELLNTFDNNTDKAIESLEQSVRTLKKIGSKERAFHQVDLASLYQYVGKMDEALHLYENAYKIFNKELDKNWASDGVLLTLTSIAKIYLLKDDCDTAFEKIKEAIKLNPNLSLSYSIRGIIYIELDQSEKAIKDFKKAIMLEPNEFGNYYNLGMLYLTKGQDKEGKENINKALELNPNNSMVYAGLAHVNRHFKQYPEEVKNLTKALELNPSELESLAIYHNRGGTYMDLGEHDKALDDFYKSLEISKKLKKQYAIADSLLHIGRIFGETNNKNKAIENTKEALKLFEKLKKKEDIERAEKQLELLQKSFA